MTIPTLLAPASSPEALYAAVQNGAGAVYLGYGPLNARRNAKNFTREEFQAAVSYCRLRGVKIYLTLNTLLTDRELSHALETASFAAECGVHGIIVQDLGLLRLLRETLPDIELHGSTQMTIHNLPGVRFCADVGISRVVLARELSREAIASIAEQSPIELEIFGHGALCMCYSGQCYFSSLVGGRSGNRGLCAQPCRLAYRFEGEPTPSYPLSLKDLSLAGRIQDLLPLPVACLKLEGRMKRPEYVATVTKIYADALKERRNSTKKENQMLRDIFSREGFTQGYFLDRKDNTMFGRRHEAEAPSKELLAQAKESYAAKEAPRIPIVFTVSIQKDLPVSLTVSDRDGHRISIEGTLPAPALQRAITEEMVKTQLSKTGGTVFLCEEVSVSLEDGLSLPLSSLNALRREALDALSQLRSAPPGQRVLSPLPPIPIPNQAKAPEIALSLLRWEQLSPALLQEKPALLSLPAAEIATHAKALSRYIADFPDMAFAVMLPRIAWDRELPLLREQLALCQRIGIRDAFVGNWGMIALCREFSFRIRGDFALGVTNSNTLAELSRLGFSSATLSFELNFPQIRDLSKAIDCDLLVYGRLPMMLTEHCLTKHQDKGCHCQNPQALIDRKGLSFPVVPSFGCRSEILNAKPLFLADKASDYRSLGLWAARLLFTTEDADDCIFILRQYRNLAPALPSDFTRGLYYRKAE